MSCQKCIITTILLLLSLTNAILDDDILYDIKWQPSLKATAELEDSLIITSKRKEKFTCDIPTIATTDATPTESILLSEINPFLEKLHAERCAYQLDTYWTYEVCHGKYVRQYHEAKIDDKTKVLQDFFLGYYHADNQDTTVSSDNQQALKIHYKTINNRIIPMLPVRYTDGTQCDINSNKPRETIVFYVCEEKSNNIIINFHETSSCHYEATIASSWLCDLPEFSSAKLHRHVINCYSHDSASQKPMNLRKLEYEHSLSSKDDGGSQFTLTSADGTTFIISYKYIDDDEDLNGAVDTISIDLPDQTSRADRSSANKLDREYFHEFFNGLQCLTGGSGWWKYEICFGKHVIQYHEDQGQRTATVVLGAWNHEAHTELIQQNFRKKSTTNSKQRPYLSLFYTNGDVCELTQMPRMVEVKLKCSMRESQSEGPTIYLVEPESCSYILGIESTVFCNMVDYTDSDGNVDYEKLLKYFQEN